MKKKLSALSPNQLERRREVKPHWLWFIPIGYVLILAFVQGSFAQLGSTYVQLLVLACLIVFAITLLKIALTEPGTGIPTGLVFVTIAGFYVSESYRYGWGFLLDLVAFGVGVALAGALALFARKRWAQRWARIVGEKWRALPAAMVILGGWAAVCFLSVARETTLPADPGRFTQISARSIVPEYSQGWADRRIGLALSGGGYRAAVFHAGTLHALETLGLRPSVLSTVSGGSIIGAYYAIGGDPVAFKDAVIAGRFNLKRELVLLHNAARLPFPMSVPYLDVTLTPFYSFSRSDVQADLLRSALFHGRESWRAPGNAQPRLVIATTEMTYGMQLGLIPEGIVTRSVGNDRRVYQGKNIRSSPELDLAERVAISGAFPVAFPAKSIDAQVVTCSSSGEGTRSLRLSDGGIADNLGLQLLETVQMLSGSLLECSEGPEDQLSADWRIDTVIVSNGGAIFGVEDDLTGLGLLSRSFDVSSANSVRRTDDTSARPIMISAAGDYLPSHTQFLLHDDEMPQDLVEQRAWRINFDPSRGYPPAVLQAIVALLPPGDREQAGTALTGYLQAAEEQPPMQGETRGKWARNLRLPSAEECRNTLQTDAASELHGLPGICDAVALRKILEPHAFGWFQAFQRTSTLNDWPPGEDVEAVFRLAQLLTYRDWFHLERALSARPVDTL
jgi:hypothetical protein